MTTFTGVDDSGKDSAQVVGNPVIYNMPAAASYSGAQTYQASDLTGGTIVHNAQGGATGTLPTAALMRIALSQFGRAARVGDTIYCLIVNGAATSGTLTLALGAGGSWDANQGAGAQGIAYQSSKTIQVRMTNVTPGSEAYTVYA
jgi:hypothetical protein